MIIKPGVTTKGVKPELLAGLMIATTVYARYATELVVTALTDGKHMPNSLHYQGLAADLRTSNVLPVNLLELFRDLKNALGQEFDVVLEKDHIHIEFDPKG